MESSDKQVYTIAEVAALVRMTEDRVYKLCRAGEIRRVKIGRQIRIPRAEVMRLLGRDS